MMKWSKNLFLSFDEFDIQGTTLCQSVSVDPTSSKEKKHKRKQEFPLLQKHSKKRWKFGHEENSNAAFIASGVNQIVCEHQ